MQLNNLNIPLGELLIEINVITSDQLSEALELQKVSGGKPLGDILVNLGFISEKQLMLALEYRFRIPYFDLSTAEIHSEMSHVLSYETAQKYNIIPVSQEGKQLTVATSDPMNFHALDDVKLQTKLEIRPVLSTSSDIKNALVKLYERNQTNEAVEDLNKEYTIEEVQSLSESINENVDNAPVVRLVNHIINHAISARTSDIHIEPMEDSVRIRFRIDGELFEQLTITKSAHAAVVTRLKIMGDMDIAERRIPQDGRVQVVFNGQPVDLRLSVLPTVTGEKVVIRILGGRGIVLERKQLGFSDSNNALFDEILKNPNGIILVSGPTGSGKSTTLYTVLTEVNKPDINIITVEDPVENRMIGVNQVQINQKAGLTFANGLRSILRQDPDVIMIGEIRDAETAEIAVRASITGHLVLSTIHTNDSASTISRLIDMGIEPFLVSASLVGVVSQRLVRKICNKCKVPHELNAAEMSFMHVFETQDVYKGTGCPNCNNTGYKGRIAIHEILVMNKKIKELVDSRATTEQIRAEAIRSGTKTLKDSCIELVLNGTTTVDELIRVAYNTD